MICIARARAVVIAAELAAVKKLFGFVAVASCALKKMINSKSKPHLLMKDRINQALAGILNRWSIVKNPRNIT